MSLLEQLLPASYKGADFLISSSSTNGGRKDEVHEFANSDRQTIEDFGLLPRSYSMVGIITGDDYLNKRDALLAALEDGETGVLSHPFYGELQNIKARSFSINENMTELGSAEISMQFDISNDNGLPVETENTLSTINKKNDDVVAAVNNEIKDNWKVEEKFSGVFKAAKEKLSEVSSTFSGSSSVVARITDNINEYNASVNDFSNEINGLSKDPVALADSITNIGKGMNGLYSTAESQATAWAGFFSIGDKDIASVNSTAGITQRESNNSVMNRSMKSQALGYSYLAAAQIEYKTIEELEDSANEIEIEYEKVISDKEIGQELRSALLIMRENTNSYFNQQLITLNRILNIDTAKLPSRVISFQYFNDSSSGAEIAELNSDANVSFLEGEIKVVTG